MHHPNIIALIEAYDTRGGRKNLVMEMADGQDLAAEIRDKLMMVKLQQKPFEELYFEEELIWNWLV